MVVIAGGLDDSNSAQRRKEPESLSGATRKVVRKNKGASQRKRSNSERTNTEVVYRDLSFIPGRDGRIDPNSISTNFSRADLISKDNEHEVTNVTINLFASLFPETFNKSTDLSPVEAATRFYNTVKIATGYTKAEILPFEEIKKLKDFINKKAEALKKRGAQRADSDVVKKEFLIFSDYDKVMEHIKSSLIKANSTPQALLFASQLLSEDSILEAFDESSQNLRQRNKILSSLEALKKTKDDKAELYHAAKNLAKAHQELEKKKNWLREIEINSKTSLNVNKDVLEEIKTRVKSSEKQYNRLKEVIKKNIEFFNMGYEGPIYPGAESAKIYNGATDVIPRDSIETDNALGLAETSKVTKFSSVFSLLDAHSEKVNRLDLQVETAKLSDSAAEGYISLMVNQSENHDQYWRDLKTALLSIPEKNLNEAISDFWLKGSFKELKEKLQEENLNPSIRKQLSLIEIIKPLKELMNSAPPDIRKKADFNPENGSIKPLIEKLEAITQKSYRESGFSSDPMGTKAFKAAFLGAEQFSNNDPSQVAKAQLEIKRAEREDEEIAKKRVQVYKNRLLKQGLEERVQELKEKRKTPDSLAALKNLYISEEGIRRNEGAAVSPAALRSAMKDLGQSLKETSKSDVKAIHIERRIRTLKNIEEQSAHLMPIMFHSNPNGWLEKFYSYSENKRALASPEQLEIISKELELREPEKLKELEKRLLKVIRKIKLEEERVSFLISKYLSKEEILQKLKEDPNFLGEAQEEKERVFDIAIGRAKSTDRQVFLIDLKSGVQSSSSIIERIQERQTRRFDAAKLETKKAQAKKAADTPRPETKELDKKAKERPIAETKKPEPIESSKGIEQRIDNQIKQLIARSIEIGGRTNSKGLGRGLNNDGTSSLKKDQYRKALEALSPEALITLYLETSMKAKLLAPILKRDNHSIHSFAKFPRLAKFNAGYKATGVSKRYTAHADFLAELISANKTALKAKSTVDSLINILKDYYMNHSDFDLHKKEIQDEVQASDGKTLEVLDYAITFFNELISKREEEITQNLLANNRRSYEEIKTYTSTGSGKEEARKHKALLEEMRNRELSPLFLALSQQFASLIKSSISDRI